MLIWRYFNRIVYGRDEIQIERIKEDLIENLNRKGIRTSFVNINLNAGNLMIRLDIEEKAG